MKVWWEKEYLSKMMENVRVMRGEMEANGSRKRLTKLNQDQYGIMPWYTYPYPSSVVLFISLCHLSISFCLEG